MTNFKIQPPKSVSQSGQDLLILNIPAGSSSKKSEIELGSLMYKKDKSLAHRSWNTFDYSGYQPPEYNLYEVIAAKDADGIVLRALSKKADLMFKAGYSITGKNNRTVEYIKDRLLQIELAQNKPMDLLFSELGADLIDFHNAFILVVRNFDNSGGNRRTVKTYGGTKQIDPVAAMFRIPPETIRIVTDKYGNPTKYVQFMPDGRLKEFKTDEIIHLYHHRRAGFNFARPGIWPGIEDIRALRRLEESMELLVQNHLFPFFLMQIGTDEHPVDSTIDGESEITVWTRKMQTMPAEGGLVVSHRHNIKLVTPEQILPIDKYIDHMKRRAYTSMGVSSVDLGEGDTANRSTADSMSKTLIDDVKGYQRTFSLLVKFEILNQLLLEGFNSTALREENCVYFSFNEIDIESTIKIENHASLMYSSNLYTESEARSKCKKDPLRDSDREDMYLERVQKVISEQALSADMELQKTNNQIKNKQQPTNQYGTKSSPEKRKSSKERQIVDHIDRQIDLLTPIDTELLKNNLCKSIFSLDLTIPESNFNNQLKNYICYLVDEVSFQSLSELQDAQENLKLKIHNLIEENQN